MNILRLKELLDEKGLQGKDLAAELGVTTTTISNFNQGNTLPKAEMMLKIAEYLDVDLRELFIRTKLPSAQKEIFIKDDNGNYRSVGFIRE